MRNKDCSNTMKNRLNIIALGVIALVTPWLQAQDQPRLNWEYSENEHAESQRLLNEILETFGELQEMIADDSDVEEMPAIPTFSEYLGYLSARGVDLGEPAQESKIMSEIVAILAKKNRPQTDTLETLDEFFARIREDLRALGIL